jgi:hypothetical protein
VIETVSSPSSLVSAGEHFTLLVTIRHTL